MKTKIINYLEKRIKESEKWDRIYNKAIDRNKSPENSWEVYELHSKHDENIGELRALKTVLKYIKSSRLK